MELRSFVAIGVVAITILCGEAMSAAAPTAQNASDAVVAKLKALRPDLPIVSVSTAPIPGMITAFEASVGKAVSKGDKLATLEAMKMQTNILAPTDGTVAEVLVSIGDAVEAGDLMIKLRE